jgi:hypothetical protein
VRTEPDLQRTEVAKPGLAEILMDLEADDDLRAPFEMVFLAEEGE